ncbi:STAS domain-containing protein [Candidatus Woesearchaeota archaeon]|nr:STAS domain-containing protein [Candidatus Woesearchaeota archaeon]
MKLQDIEDYRDLEKVDSRHFFDVFVPSEGSGMQDLHEGLHVLKGKGVFSWGCADELKELHEKYGLGMLVLDLGNVSWIDSPGLGAIMRAHLRSSRSRKSLRLCNLSNDVEVALTLSNAWTMMRRFDTLKDALVAEQEPRKGLFF